MSVIRTQWWSWSTKGLLFAFFGLYTFWGESGDLRNMVGYLFGSLFILGLIELFYALYVRKKGREWMSWTFTGLLQGFIGAWALFYLERSVELYIILTGAFSLLLGLILLFLGIRAMGNSRPVIILNSVISLIVGVLVLYNPFDSLSSTALLVAICTIVLGLALIYMGIYFRIRGDKEEEEEKENRESVRDS